MLLFDFADGGCRARKVCNAYHRRRYFACKRIDVLGSGRGAPSVLPGDGRRLCALKDRPGRRALLLQARARHDGRLLQVRCEQDGGQTKLTPG